MDSGRLVFDSGVARRAAAGGGQMLLFGGGGGFIRGDWLVMDRGGRAEQAAVLHDARGAPGRGVLRRADAGEEAPSHSGASTCRKIKKKESFIPEMVARWCLMLCARARELQVRLLESSFEEENKLEPERKSELARRLGMAPRQVAVWFQNRRARWKTKHLEQEYDRLKAAHDALLADHGDLLKDNDHLRSQVTSLTEKLQAKELSGSENAGPECEPDEQTAAAAAAAAAVQRKGEDHLSSETNASAVLDVAEGTHHSGQSYFTGEEGRTGGILSSSSEEDGGVVSDDGCSFFSDALFVAATEHHREHAEEVEAQLGSWTWFWN